MELDSAAATWVNFTPCGIVTRLGSAAEPSESGPHVQTLPSLSRAMELDSAAATWVNFTPSGMATIIGVV